MQNMNTAGARNASKAAGLSSTVSAPKGKTGKGLGLGGSMEAQGDAVTTNRTHGSSTGFNGSNKVLGNVGGKGDSTTTGKGHGSPDSGFTGGLINGMVR